MDEIAVRADKRVKGVGTALCKAYLKQAQNLNMREVVLRTDQRNTASMKLFSKNGFEPIPDDGIRGAVYDPAFENRIYLKNNLGGKE